jgi:signal transduction histidine kinase
MNNTGKTSLTDALYSISRLPGSDCSADEVLGSILDEILKVVPAKNAGIALINPDSGTLEIEATRGTTGRGKQLQASLGEGVAGWVALHGQPLLVPNVLKDPRYAARANLVLSELAVPMIERGTVMGVINLVSDAAEAFDEQSQADLTRLCDEATRVITLVWHIDQLQSKAKQLETLVDTARELVGRLDMSDLFGQITSEALNLGRFRLAALFLYDKDAERLKLEALSGTRSLTTYSETLQLEESAIGTAIRRRKQVEVADLPRSEEHHFIEVVQSEGLVSMLASPLLFENEVVGVLNIYTDQRHRFTNDERNILSALCGISALAITNARLYKRVFQTEDTLRRNDRLTTLGLLSAEIAHEIRNPLTVIKLLFGSLNLEFPEDDMRKRDAEIIAEKLDQLEDIVTKVLSYGKNSEGLHSIWDLRRIVDDTLFLVRLKLRQSGVQLDYDKPQDPLMVEVSKGQIQQAVLNIVMNALQAMPGGGGLHVRLGNEEIDGSPCCYIRVADTGTGIPEGIRGKIFDSFLTSKANGTGLGLNISKRILKSHNGDISIESTSETGTVVKLWLPLHKTA